MFKKKVKYFFWGEEKLIMDTIYYPIPPTKYDAGIRANQELKMKDKVGTVVTLSVKYDKPLKTNSDVSASNP